MAQYRSVSDATEDLLARLREGHNLKRACELANVSYETVLDWRDKGRIHQWGADRQEPYASFFGMIAEAVILGAKFRPPSRPAGRKPKDIPAHTRAILIDRLVDGCSYPVACRSANISLETFVSWLRLGGHPNPPTPYRRIDPVFVEEPYRSFVLAVQVAEAFGAEKETHVQPGASEAGESASDRA